MTFSWESFNKRTLDKKLQRAKIMAKGNINSDYDIRHSNEIREFAKTGTYTELTKRVTDEVTKKQQQALQRRLRLVGKI